MFEDLFYLHKGFYSPDPSAIDTNEILQQKCTWYSLEDRVHGIGVDREWFNSEPRNLLEYVPQQHISLLKEPQARLVINNSRESKFLRLTDNIYPHLHKTIDDNNLDAAKIAYWCGNLNENKVYDAWCRANKVQDRIEIFPVMGWWQFSINNYGHYHSSWHNESKVKKFLCLNRRMFDAPHRQSVVYHLHRLGEINQGLVSTSGYQDPDRAEQYAWNRNSYTTSTRKRILDIDTDTMNAGEAADKDTHHLHRLTAFSIVTESSHDNQAGTHRFYTEKTLRAALYGHPFVVVGEAGANTDLVKLGLEPYNELFDLGTDFIADTEHRVQHQLESIRWDWKPQAMHHQLREKIHRNRQAIMKNTHNKRSFNSIQRWALDV